jgi:hypothetical protein
MAPATADVQAPSLPSLNPAFREPSTEISSGASYYKDPFIAGRAGYKPENETQGTEKFPAAKHQNYLPTWNPEESKSIYYHANIISLIAVRIFSTSTV